MVQVENTLSRGNIWKQDCLGREYPILEENSENAMLWSKIVPFPFTANITESEGSGQKSSLTVKIPELRCLCRTCLFQSKIIKTKCFGRNSPSRAKLLNLRCNVHKYFSQIVVSRSKSSNFGKIPNVAQFGQRKSPFQVKIQKLGY